MYKYFSFLGRANTKFIQVHWESEFFLLFAFSSLCIYGIADLASLSVLAWESLNYSWCLVLTIFMFKGIMSDVFSLFVRFFVKFKHCFFFQRGCPIQITLEPQGSRCMNLSELFLMPPFVSLCSPFVIELCQTTADCSTTDLT